MKGQCVNVRGVSVFVRDSYTTRDCWGLADQPHITGQPVLQLKSLLEQLALLQRPCHLEGETAVIRDWLWLEPQPYLQPGRSRMPPRTLQQQCPGTSYLSCKSTNAGTPTSPTTGAWEVCSGGDKRMNFWMGPVPFHRAEETAESKSTHPELVN